MARRMMVGLMLSPQDLSQGLELLKLWADLEDSFNNAITVAICVRFDMDIDRDVGHKAIEYASKKFNVITKKVGRVGTGWPAGCNALEIGAYEWFVESNRNGVFDFEYLFLCESDTVPLRKGWLIEIMNEAFDNQAMIIGAYFTQEDGCAHINGNCVMHRDMWKTIRTIWQVPNSKGWDCFIGPKTLIHGKPSRLIWQDYRLGAPDNPWKGDDFLFAPKVFNNQANPLYNQSLQPAMIHGVKTFDGIKAVRKRILQESVDT